MKHLTSIIALRIFMKNETFNIYYSHEDVFLIKIKQNKTQRQQQQQKKNETLVFHYI